MVWLGAILITILEAITISIPIFNQPAICGLAWCDADYDTGRYHDIFTNLVTAFLTELNVVIDSYLSMLYDFMLDRFICAEVRKRIVHH